MDSVFDSHAVVATCIRAGAGFSITTKQTRPVRAAIGAIGACPGSDHLSTRDLRRGQREVDPRRRDRRNHLHRISVPAEIRADHGPVDCLAGERQNVVPGQGGLFTAWRYHAFITDSTLQLVAAEKRHREHAIIEQVNADLKDSALAHIPSVTFSPFDQPVTFTPKVLLELATIRASALSSSQLRSTFTVNAPVSCVSG